MPICFLDKFNLMFYLFYSWRDTPRPSNNHQKDSAKKILEDYQEAMNIIEEYENFIKTNNKKIIRFAYQQGKVFKKLKKNRKFKNLVGKFKINKSTIIFKINIVKIVDKYPKMLKRVISV